MLQTPEFVEEFILDLTLAPAIAEFGHDVGKMIDPTCGSGHIVLGAFHPLLKEWEQHAPNHDPHERVRRGVRQRPPVAAGRSSEQSSGRRCSSFPYVRSRQWTTRFS
ncbi:hypothetical protein ABZ356_24250 [Micromonospora zamorensis]|uniref:hypothetical protein n=1 Tax=Micromonospora zamorensis TaxID=709883 RepID=UPI0033E24F6E